MRAVLVAAALLMLAGSPVLVRSWGEGSARPAGAASDLINPGFEDGQLDGDPLSWSVTQPVPDVVRVVDSEGAGEFLAYADMGGITVDPYRGALMLRAGTPRRVAQNQDVGPNQVTQTFTSQSSSLGFALRVFSWEHRGLDEIRFDLRQGSTSVGTLTAPFVLSPANGSPSSCSALPCSVSIDVGSNGDFLDGGWQVVDITGIPIGVTLTFEFSVSGTGSASHGTWAYLDSAEQPVPTSTPTDTPTATFTPVPDTATPTATPTDTPTDTPTATSTPVPPPVAKFVFDPIDPNEGDTVLFSDASFDPAGQAIVSWEWVIDGEPLDAQNPVYVFPDEGTYVASLTITTSDGRQTTVATGETALDGTPIPPLVVGSADPLVNALNVEALAGQPAPLLGRFAEPGWEDTHTAQWNVTGDPAATVQDDGLPAYSTGLVTGSAPFSEATAGELVVTDDNGGSGADAFSVTIVADDAQRHEPNDDMAAPPELRSDGSYLSYIQSPGDVDIYDVKLPGGSSLPSGAEVLVTLTGLPADYDVALLADSGAPGVAAGDSGQTSFESAAFARSAFARSAFARSAFARSAFARSAFARSAFARSGFTFAQLPLSEMSYTGINGETINGTDIGLGELGLQALEDSGIRIAGFSANRGLENDVVFARTAAAGTRMFIAVVGANGEFNAAPYRLNVETSVPIDLEALLGSAACTGTPLVGAGDATSGIETLYDFVGTPTTLFVTQRQRMQAAFPTSDWNALVADLASLSLHQAVQGEVISLPSDIYDAWDISPCSIDAANALTEQIKTALSPLLAGVQYVVFVGDDGIVPFRRVPDETAVGNERDYSFDALLRPGSPLFASVALGFNLTDDFYVDADPSAWQGRELYVPDLPASRLVETPEEIRGQAQAFLASNGVLNPDSGFVAGYDFFADGAQEMANSLNSAVPTDTLISNTWTADDLRCGLLGSGGCNTPSLAAPQAHFLHYAAVSANGFETLDFDDFMASEDVAGALDALTGSVVFSMGCHAGFNVPDRDSEAADDGLGLDPALDFAQAMAQQRALFIASTGFGLGDDAPGVLGGTERLLAIFADGIVAGDVAAGDALVAAKQDYVLTTASFTVYDEKSTINTTLYGLPMYHVVTAGGGGGVTAGGISAAAPSSLSLTITDGASTTTDVIPYAEVNTSDGTFFAAGGDVQATAARPVQPRVVVEPGAGVPLHSALIVGGTYEDIVPFDPLIAQMTMEWGVGGLEPNVCLPSFWPSQPTKVNSLETIGGLLQTLVVVPAQFRCDSGSGSDVSGLERLYSSLELELLRCADDDHVAPAIKQVELVTEGTTVHATIDATDENGIARIIALVFGSGAVTPTTLNVAAEDAGPYELDILDVQPDDRMVIQVQDGACNVASATGRGTKLATMQIEALGDGQFVPGEAEPFPVKVYNYATLTAPLYFSWDFGDGTLVSGTLAPGDLTPDGLGNVTFSVDHTYALGDTGTATVTVLDAAGGIALDEVGFGCDGSDDDDVDALSICTELVIGTDPLVNDTDGDGCADGEEVLNPTHTTGGQRDPLDFWDFYDVTGDMAVSDLSDTILILQHFGHNYNGGAYQDPLDDLLDRFVPNSAQPWRSAEANDGVDLRDALSNLSSFGDSCAAPP